MTISREELEACKTRADVVPLYVRLINDRMEGVPEVNAWIIQNWSRAALKWIKNEAWKIVDKEISARRAALSATGEKPDAEI